MYVHAAGLVAQRRVAEAGSWQVAWAGCVAVACVPWERGVLYPSLVTVGTQGGKQGGTVKDARLCQ